MSVNSNVLMYAKYIYNKVDRDRIKTQKLLYISFGFYGVRNNGKYLFNETIEAWKYGPVVPLLHSIDYNFESTKELKKEEKLQEERKIIDEVLTCYNNKSASNLIDLTHQKGTPWDKVYNNEKEGRNKEIHKEDIIFYYKNLLNVVDAISTTTGIEILSDFAKR